MFRRLLILLLLLAPPALAAKGTGVVSCADPRAAKAGQEILRAGGSAIDAAIAMMLALNVVEPQSSGIGGGAFLVLHDARTGRIETIDGREAAPATADLHWFYQRDGQPLSHMAAVPGGRSVGVPGALRLMALAHRDHGTLPWARLFQPAIRLARGGVAITPRLAHILDGSTAYPGGPREDRWAGPHYFGADGRPKPAGTVLANPQLAALFARIAAHGPDSFYSGPIAQALVATVDGAARNPSRMAIGDLASYDARARPPVCGAYRGYRICGMGPPSSGGVAVLMILRQLERFDLAALGKDSPVAWHLLAESERLAYADRDMFVGDPDFVSVPLAGLLDRAYLARRSALIALGRTMATVVAGDPAGAPPRVKAVPAEAHGTTDLVAVDARGDVAEVTTTIESPFGSGLTVSGAFLNNELTDFDIVPETGGSLAVNRVEGGKRPRSSMAPTIVYDRDGEVRLALGAAGGPTIIAQVAKAIIGVIDWHLSAQDAIALPLVFAPGRTGYFENSAQFARMKPALEALGESVVLAPLGLKANAVERVGGQWVGAADPRSEGAWLGEDGRTAPIARVDNATKAPSE